MKTVQNWIGWILGFADTAREWVLDAAPPFVDPIVERLPNWAVLPIAAVLVLGFVWGMWTLVRTVLLRVFRPQQFVAEQPATVGGLTSVRDEVAALRAEIAAMAAAAQAKGEAVPLNAEAQAKAETAIESIARDPAPAVQAAVGNMAAGHMSALIQALEDDARAEEQARRPAEAASKWRRLSDLVRGFDAQRAKHAYAEAFRLEPADFWTCIELARLARIAGDLALARVAAEAALSAAKSDRDRGVAANDLGNVLREAGDLSGAKGRYEEGLKVSERLAAANPSSAEAQRDLWVSFNKLGNVLREAGDLSGAKGRYEEDLKISERLAAANPTSVEAQRDLWVSYDKLGEVLQEAGDLSGANGRYEAGLKVSERLAAANPSSGQAQRDLSISYERLGDVLEEMSDYAGAVARYEQSLPIAHRLANNNPSHPGFQKDLAATERRLSALRAKLEGRA